MITVAIAVKDVAATKQYRSLLAGSGVDAHYATDIPTLIRLVKGRPIDVVIFDLARNALSINSWLAEVGRDRDLALAPVLWIGSGILPDMKKLVEQYRPGIYMPNLPDLDNLKLAINRLIGRIPAAPVGTAGQGADPEDESLWAPGEQNIDDALSIFAENGRSKSTSAGRPAAPQQNRPAETIPFPVSAKTPRMPVPGPGPSARQAAQGAHTALSDQEIEAIAEKVSKRLAGDLLRRLTRDDLRRLVEETLTGNPVHT